MPAKDVKHLPYDHETDEEFSKALLEKHTTMGDKLPKVRSQKQAAFCAFF